MDSNQTLLCSSAFVKRCAVIDGMNLLHTASRGSKVQRFYELDAIVLLVVAREFLRRDFDVRIFLPIKRMKFLKNKSILEELDGLNIFEYSYVNYDDMLILQYAAQAGGFVISRDKFRDIIPIISMLGHMGERCCHVTFLKDRCEMMMTIDDDRDDGNQESEEKDSEWEDEFVEAEKLIDITSCLTLDENTENDANLKMFYSHEDDLEYSAAQLTRSYFTEERRQTLLAAIEEKFERLYYNARSRDRGLTLTSLVYLKSYFRPDGLDDAFRVIRDMNYHTSREFASAKEQIRDWFVKAVHLDVVNKALSANPKTFMEMWELCDKELRKVYDFTGKRFDLHDKMPIYDGAGSSKLSATQKALFELDMD